MGNGIYKVCSQNAVDPNANMNIMNNTQDNPDYSRDIYRSVKNSNKTPQSKENALTSTLTCIQNFKNSNYLKPPEKHHENLTEIYNSFIKLHSEPTYLKEENEEELSEAIVNHKGDVYKGHWGVEYKQITGEIENIFPSGFGKLFLSDRMIVGIFKKFEVVQNQNNTPRIFYENGNVYEGSVLSHGLSLNGQEQVENISYLAHGKGKLYLKDGNSIEANFINDKMDGEVKKIFRSFTLRTEYSDNKMKSSKGKIAYDDSSVYEGEFDKNFLKHGKGISNNADGTIFSGTWNKGVFHGKGQLFVPEKSKTIGFYNNNSAEMPYGPGTYTSGNWIDGLLTGHGNILNSKGKFKCLWRYGSLISSVYVMTNKVKLHENIFTFLNSQQLNTLLKIPNKVVDNYFSKNNMDKLIELRLLDLAEDSQYKNMLPENLFKKSSLLLNRFKNRIQNIKDVMINALLEKDEFLPIVTYKSDGGINQKRFHHSHIFNPDVSKAYCTHPLIEKKQNVTVSGLICADIIQEIAIIKNKSENGIVNDKNDMSKANPNKDNNTNEINITNRENKSALLNVLNIVNRNISPKELKRLLINYPKLKQSLNIETRKSKASIASKAADYIKSASVYSQAYDKLSHLHEIDYYKIHMEDKKIFEFCTNSNTFGNQDKGLFFSLHDITIYTPIFLAMYTVLNNPVRTIAVFLHNEDPFDISGLSNSLLPKPLVELNINELKNNTDVINYQENKSHSFFEFSHPENNLIAIIQIKDYSEPILVQLKKYYHFGKYVTLKMIDQNALYGANITGIDCGTVLFYGQTFNINA